MKLTPAAFSNWCLRNLDCDTWFSQLTLGRKLAGVTDGTAFTAAGLLGALKRAGWVERHPTMPGIYCLPQKCWLPKKQKPSLRE